MQKIFWLKEKWKIGKFTAKLTILCCDNFGENQTPLQRMAWLLFPKTIFYEKIYLLLLSVASKNAIYADILGLKKLWIKINNTDISHEISCLNWTLVKYKESKFHEAFPGLRISPKTQNFGWNFFLQNFFSDKKRINHSNAFLSLLSKMCQN